MQEERVLHDAKLAKMEAEMKMVFQQKVQEKEAKLKQSEEELYARHREMKESLEKQRLDLEEKKRRVETGRPMTPEKGTVRDVHFSALPLRMRLITKCFGRRRQGKVSSAIPELLDGYLLSVDKIHFYPCLLFSWRVYCSLRHLV
jgi:exonuclease VII large subunit